MDLLKTVQTEAYLGSLMNRTSSVKEMANVEIVKDERFCLAWNEAVDETGNSVITEK